MTVPSSTRRAGPFAGNGVTASFPFTFKVFSGSDIAVYLTAPGGVQTLLGSGYTVTLNGDQDASPGGSIGYLPGGSPMATGYSLDVVGALAYTQGTDITNAGRFLPQVIENALDKLTILGQQLLEKFARVVTFPVGDTASGTLPTVANRAGKALIFDASGNVTVGTRENINAIDASVAAAGVSAASALTSKNAAGVSETNALGYSNAAAASSATATAARSDAVAAAAAASVTLAAYATIAVGRAAVADGVIFWVKPFGTDGLTSFTAYQRTSSSTQTLIGSIALGSDMARALGALYKVGRNIFNKNAAGILANTRINQGSGAVDPNVSYGESLSPYIAVAPSTTYIVNHPTGVQVSEWKVDKTYIGRSGRFFGASFATNALTAFVRIEFLPADANGLQLELGTAPSGYEAYHEWLDSTLPDVAAILQSATFTAAVPMFAPGRNIFNDAITLTPDRSIRSDGFIQTTVGRNLTDYFPVKPLTQYSTNALLTLNLDWYDSIKRRLGPVTDISQSIPFTSPANAAFARVSTADSAQTLVGLQIEEGATISFWEQYALGFQGVLSRSSVRNAMPGGTNDFALPRKLYFLKGSENNVYHRCVQRRWLPNNFFTRLTGTVGGVALTSRDRYSRVTPTATSAGAAMTATLYDADLDVVKTQAVTAVVTDPATPSAATNVLALGDSFLDIGVILRKLIQTVSNVSLIGSRKITTIQGVAYGGPDIRYDGRSGADLAYLFTAIKSNTGFSPFLHPPGYTYLGNTGTWKDAMAATPSFFTNGMKATGLTLRGGFSASTGYPATPVTNDLIWDNTLTLYKAWDGSAWQTVAPSDASFVFDVTKYLALYGIAVPKIVYVAMGINDFSGQDPRLMVRRYASGGTTYTAPNLFSYWFNAASTGYMQMLIAAFRAYDPSIKIGILVPPTLSAVDGGGSTIVLARQAAAMWEARKAVITAFDTVGNDAINVTVVDCGVALDPTYGYDVTGTAPFSLYTRADTESTAADTTHPHADGFNQMGLALAAWVQAVR